MTLADLIICDDIRQEINRKFTLVGVYGDTINLIPMQGQPVAWPVGINLGLFIRLKLDSSDEIKYGTNFEFIVLHNAKELARFEGSISTKEPVKQIFAIPLGAVIPIPGPGQITFQLKLKTDGIVYQEFSPDRLLEIVEQPIGVTH